MTLPVEYEFNLPRGELELDEWIKVEGMNLRQPISIKVRFVAGALAIVGVQIDEGAPVSSADLRAVRLGALTDQLNTHLRDLAAWFLEDAREADRELEFYGVDPRGATAPEYGTSTPEGHALMRLREAWAGYDRLSRWHRQGSDLGDEASLARGRGASPPSQAELRRFAAILRDEKSNRQRGAVTRTAHRIGVDRSTAHRWIKLCKQQGLLPQDQEGRQ